MKLSRRRFIEAGAVGAILPLPGIAAQAAAREPWYRRVKRWGQVNITENDVTSFDIRFWRDYIKMTGTQGVLYNAAGMVAYYPTKVPFQRRSEFLGDRDLLGDLAAASRADGVTFVARLSYSNWNPEMFATHPDWSTADIDGKILAKPCMNGGYITEYWRSILEEIVRGYKPDGFSSSGWGSNYDLCYCENCKRLYKSAVGKDLPRAVDWRNPDYREWVRWNGDRVVALWDHQNEVTRKIGGRDCYWIGQFSMRQLSGTLGYRDVRRIAQRAPLLMIDHQFRVDDVPMSENSAAGRFWNGVAGWEKPVTEAQAIYVGRLASAPVVETQAYTYSAIAGGFLPWWHTIGADHDDRRRYDIVGPVFHWHAGNEKYLTNRKPVATVALVWSDTNVVFHGRDRLEERVFEPWNGMADALVRARIPFVIIHADDLDRDARGIRTLVLPDLAAMSDAQVASVRRFVEGGGGLVATGDSSLFDANGEVRSDYALADMFGISLGGDAPSALEPEVRSGSAMLQGVDLPRWALVDQTYLRLAPELRGRTFGPHMFRDLKSSATRHPVLAGLDKTDIVFFGGKLQPAKAAPSASVLATFVPPSPFHPPENAWMRTRNTDIPAIIVNEVPGRGRVVFVRADLDRGFARMHFQDHADILANAVRWTAADDLPVIVEGPGLWDINLYRQPGRLVLHLGSQNAGATRPPVDDYPPIGPLKIRLASEEGIAVDTAKLLVAEQAVPARRSGQWIEFTVPEVKTHEVIVIGSV